MEKMPKTYDLGFGPLVELSYLETVFGITRRAASRYLKALHIQPVHVGGQVLFSLNTFKRILFVLSRPGGLGFAFPGSTAKGEIRKENGKNLLIEVTDCILELAADPRILSEMAGCSGNDPSILKKFIAKPVGRPVKEKE